MGLLDQLEQRFLQPIFDAVLRALGPFGKAFKLIGKVFENVKKSFELGKQCADLIASEISAWRNFREALPYRTGVISLPAAVEKTQNLLDEIRAAWDSIVDLAKQTRDLLTRAGEAPPEEEAAAAVQDIEEGGFKNLLTRFPKLAKGLTKVLEFLTLLTFVFDQTARTFQDLLTILQTLRDLREEIETGSTVFLSQKNPRKILTTDSGEKFKIRLGNLHQ